MPTRNVNLAPEQGSFVDEMVRSGRYQNASEAMRDAVRALRARLREEEVRLQALRSHLVAGAAAVERGEFEIYDADGLASLMDRMISATR